MKSPMRVCLVTAALFSLWGCDDGDAPTNDGVSPDGATPMMQPDGPDGPDGPDAPDGGMEQPPPAVPDAGWLAAETLGPCEAPADLGDNPLLETASLNLISATGVRPLHVTDIQRAPDRDRLYTVGAGGLFIVDYANGQMSVVGMSSSGGRGGRSFDKVEPLDNGLVLLSARDRGFTVYDASNPGDLESLGTLDIENASGMAYQAPYAYVLTHTGTLHTVDLTDPSSPSTVHTLEGLGNPWELVLVGQRAYVADNTLGVVVVDLSTPAAPVLGASVPAAGSAQDIDIDADHLFVAVGAAGVEAFSLVDPDLPASVSLTDFGASVVSVSADNGLVWGANHDAVAVADTRDPSAPVPQDIQATEEWAMHVDSEGDTAFVADWGQLLVLDLNREQPAPAASVDRAEILLVPGTETTRLTLTNRGSAALEIAGLSMDDGRFGLTLEKSELAPGESTGIELAFAEDGESVSSTLCLATNDPGSPVLRVPVSSSQDGAEIGIGEMAPDFVLRDLDGNTHQLSDQRGKPVVLAYFATW